jgi:hypothetical protein
VPASPEATSTAIVARVVDSMVTPVTVATGAAV